MECGKVFFARTMMSSPKLSLSMQLDSQGTRGLGVKHLATHCPGQMVFSAPSQAGELLSIAACGVLCCRVQPEVRKPRRPRLLSFRRDLTSPALQFLQLLTLLRRQMVNGYPSPPS